MRRANNDNVDDRGVEWVEQTARWSIAAQVVLGLVTLLGFVKVPSDDTQFLSVLLVLDVAVQLVEFTFYAIFVWIKRLDTWYRYLDWYISTPIMLVQTMALLEYMRDTTLTVGTFASVHWRDMLYVILVNSFMLSFGLSAELGWIPRGPAIALGFVPFVAVFAVMFARFSHDAASVGILLFMCVVWALYGFAALLAYVPKNVAYNCLDVLSKNFYGVVVAGILLAS